MYLSASKHATIWYGGISAGLFCIICNLPPGPHRGGVRLVLFRYYDSFVRLLPFTIFL